MNTPQQLDWPDWKRLQKIALAVGCAGLFLCAVGAIFDRQQFFRSYLSAFTSWAGIALGSLALWMIHNLTGGAWGLVLRRLLEAATRTLPLLVIAFLPVAFALPYIYSWAGPGDPAAVLEHNPRPEFLNIPFFLARTGVYFAAWLILAFFLNRWSAEQDRSADPRPALRMQALSGPGLVIYGLTMTFASVDWIMSLDPTWSSTIFGALVATGQMLPALGLVIALATLRSEGRGARGETNGDGPGTKDESRELKSGPATHAADPSSLAPRPPSLTSRLDVWNDLGNLLLTFVMLWAYMMFSQLLLIWSGNLPEELSFYLIRSEGGWQWVGVMLAIFYFALPFVLLLSRDIKRKPERLRIVALAVAGMSFVHQFWMIAPVFSPRHFSWHWMDVTTLAGVGGFWFWWFLWQLQARPLLPIHEPALTEAVSHA